MGIYCIFLRGVNVSGKNIVKMDVLKTALQTQGFTNSITYIQSGNIVVSSTLTPVEIQQCVQEILMKTFQVNTTVFVVLLNDLEKVLQNNPFPSSAMPNKVFITFLNEVPSNTLVNALQNIDFGEEVFQIIDNILYFYVPNGMGSSKMNNNFFEKKLKVIATGRNLNTIQKMIALSKTI